MAHSDIVVFFLIYLQPLIIGFFMVCALRQGLSTAPYFSWLVGARRHRKNARFFECAARPRLLSLFTYELPFLAFCALFILYDADLLFFLPEIVAGEFWTPSQFYVLFVCVGFFGGGLWYDLNRCGFLWEI